MSYIAASEDSLQAIAAASSSDERDPRQALSVWSSVVLHGLVLILLFLGPPLGMGGSHGALQMVPIEIVSAVEAAAAVTATAKLADAPKGDGATGSAPTPPAAADARPSETAPPPPDELTIKLQSLARLRQPDTERPLARQSASTMAAAAQSDSAAPGRFASLKDFIRVQVERHWSFNLASLGTGNFSVPIEVRITDRGVVLNADILPTARSADAAYRDVAMSARNAALLASPLDLPAGDYDKVMDLVLYLDPREAVR